MINIPQLKPSPCFGSLCAKYRHSSGKHRNAKKKQQYNEAVEDRRGTFNPFIATCDAVVDIEAEHYIKILSSNIAENGGKAIL